MQDKDEQPLPDEKKQEDTVEKIEDTTENTKEKVDASSSDSKDGKVDDKKKDEDTQKQMVGKSASPLTVHKENKEAIERIEKVKSRAEKKLAQGPSSFNKQVIKTEFYRDNFRVLVRVALVNCVVMTLIIMGMIFYMFQKQPDNRFFATTVDGRIMQLIPLDQANMNHSELYSWVVQAVNDTLTFGYHDYQRRLQDSTHYFTRDGWESFAEMLQDMQLIDRIGRSKLVVKATPRTAPELEQEAVFNGRYRWVLTVDFTITFQGRGVGGGSRTLPLRLTIERVPVLENIKGIAIKRWDALPS